MISIPRPGLINIMKLENISAEEGVSSSPGDFPAELLSLCDPLIGGSQAGRSSLPIGCRLPPSPPPCSIPLLLLPAATELRGMLMKAGVQAEPGSSFAC